MSSTSAHLLTERLEGLSDLEGRGEDDGAHRADEPAHRHVHNIALDTKQQ